MSVKRCYLSVTCFSMNPFAYISESLHHLMMAEPKEKIEEKLNEKDQEENRNQLKMKLGEMRLSKFGFGFELTGFTAFLGWAGMCLFSLLGLVGSALITVPIDIPNLFRGSGINWEVVVALMQGFGSAFLLIAVGFFLLNFFLRKKNKENDFQGVKKMLTMICSISIVIRIIVYSVLLIWSMYEILNGILAPRHFSSLILFPALIIQCLLLHGIKNERSGFIKAFLIFHYTLFVFLIVGLAIASIGSACFYGMFTVVLCGLLYIMILTFIFVFNIGFYVVLHSFYLEKEKNQQQMKKNIEFVNMSFEK